VNRRLIVAKNASPDMPSSIALGSGAGNSYRPDVDGLRALAVIPVILFHAGIAGLSGGFVGVDVFFVISGYLITGILHRELSQGSFSILKFYERRVRRIMPNLLALLLTAIVAFSIICIPNDLYGFGQSIIATLTFSANIYFYLKMGYFAPLAQQIPLLHMWSLGIEEQYYLLFPFILRFFFGLRRSVFFGVMWVLFFASLALSTWYVAVTPDVAFYSPACRLWELMTGSLLAVGAIPGITFRPLREAVALLGLAAIVATIVLFDAKTPFPGLAALLPCLGAGALLHTNRVTSLTLAGRVLAWPPFVAIGLVSYSLYIWHWPVIVFTQYLLQRPLHPAELVIMMVAIAVLATSAWQWVEKPMRAHSIPVRRLLFVCGTGAMLVTVLALAIVGTRGLPMRYDPATRRLAMAANDTNPIRAMCDHPSPSRLNAGQVCHVGPKGLPRFAMIGDSFGDALLPGISRAAEQSGVPGIVMTFSGCAPLPDVDEPAGLCRRSVQAAYDLVARQPSITSVMLIGRWPAMVAGAREGLFKQDGIWLSDAQSHKTGQEENAQVVARGLLRSVQAAAPARLVIVTGMPEQRVDVPQAATLAQMFGWRQPALPRSKFEARQAMTRRVIAQVGTMLHHPVSTLDLAGAMCGASECPTVADGTALYADDNHPSRTFAERLSGSFMPFLDEATETQSVEQNPDHPLMHATGKTIHE